MKLFATREAAANGQLALALAIATLKHLPPETVKAALNEADRLLPGGAGRTDAEARELMNGIREYFGLMP
jgi:hypothetical protein